MKPAGAERVRELNEDMAGEDRPKGGRWGPVCVDYSSYSPRVMAGTGQVPKEVRDAAAY